MNNHVEQLADCRPPVSPKTTCHDVYELFMGDPDAFCIAVCEADRIVGLVNRQDFVLRYTYQLGPDLYGKRAITHLMDSRPLIVDTAMVFDAISGRIAGERASGLLRGFVVTRNGDYHGVGTALTLLRLMLDLSEMRASALEIERQRVEEANRSKTEFLASMSHELRTPLNAIIGFTDFMATEPYGPIEPPRYGEYVGDVNTSAHHLLGLINDLLDMAKIESGHIELHETEFPASRPILETLQMLRQSAADADVTLTWDLPGQEVYMYADERMSKQVMLNLLSNAIKFTPAGGSVEVRAVFNAAGLRVSVEDTGIGIPADRIETVLEPFEQVESAMSRTRPGTGLGLPLARAMVEAHGCTLSLSSEIGHGTKVEVLVGTHRITRLGGEAAASECGTAA